MSSLLGQTWFVIPAVGALVFLVVYLWSDRVLSFFHRKSLGQREEIIRLLELMFVPVDRKRITQLMLLMSFGSGLLVFMLFWPNLWAGVIFGSAVTVAGWSVPKLIVMQLWNKRCNLFVDQMVDGLTILANGVKAGLSVQQSMERIVQNLPNPISQEFALVLSQIRMSRSLEEALNDLAVRIPRQDVQMFVTSVTILTETGGNMAETFQTIVHTVRERQKVEKKIEALTAQGLMQGTIITIVPFVLMAIMWFLNPTYMAPMFTTFLGVLAMLAVLALITIGGVMILKIVKIKV